MARPPIGGRAMTAAERQRRRRWKLSQQEVLTREAWLKRTEAITEALCEMAWVMKHLGLSVDALRNCTRSSKTSKPRHMTLPTPAKGNQSPLPGCFTIHSTRPL